MSLALITACTHPEKGGQRGFDPGETGGAPSTTDGGLPRKTCGDVLCDPNATCSGTGQDAKCTCLPGFDGDGVTCTDIDECADPSKNDCDANAECDNRPGRFLCKCKEGFLGDGKTCSGVDECQGVANSCDTNAVCEDTSTSFDCHCKPGYQNVGATGATGVAVVCADVDECADATLYSCAPNAHCENTFGAFDCACDAGFTGDGNVACRSFCDVARTDPNVCAPQGLCRPTGTSGSCDACAPGYTGNGKTCSAVTCDSACDGLGTDDAAHAVCMVNGDCACAPGYTGTPGSCADIDECSSGANCGANADCTNTDGGFVCACKPGYARDGSGACVDVDECASVPGPCHPDATCTNKAPDATGLGYECRCSDGFSGDGTACADVDECQTNNGGCASNAVCVNGRGTFECRCQAPLVGDANNCHCDLSGLWAMQQDLDTCWKGRPILEGTEQDLVSAGEMEATVWELYEVTYDGSELRTRRAGCGTDNTPDLISPLFRETYSSYVPLATFDALDLSGDDRFSLPGLVPGSPLVTTSMPAVVGIDLGGDPLTTPWPDSHAVVAESSWIDEDHDGEPGISFWPHVPSERTDTGASHYSYIPVRPAIGGTRFYVDERTGCVSVAARVITHLEGVVESCTKITGKVVNEKTEGRVHSCTLIDKGTCSATDPNDCSGWKQDVGCTAPEWAAARDCTTEDVDRLDDDQNQVQDSRATFVLERVADVGGNFACSDVRAHFPPIDRTIPTISCTTPP